MSQLSHESIDEIRQHFAFFDQDNNGFIEVKEFIQLLKTIAPGTTDEQGVNGFEIVDENNDGLIEIEEFIAWWQTIWYEF